MSNLAARFPDASFAQLSFPFIDCTVKGSLRQYTHEYPHAPGGEIEPLGRRLYEITFTCDFHDVWTRFPHLWPERLALLRSHFESGGTKALVIPQIGEIQAKCIDWDQRLTARVLSGERCTFKFLEDARADSIGETVVTSVAALAPIMATLLIEADAADRKDLFSALTDLVDSITAVGDQIELQGDLMNAKVQSLVGACQRLDRALNRPSDYAVVDSLHELGVTALKVHRDILAKGLPIVEFVVPVNMAVPQVSQAIFGTTDKAIELLKMNSFDDAFAVRAQTRVRHYKVAA